MPTRQKPKTPRNLRLAAVDGKAKGNAVAAPIQSAPDVAIEVPLAPSWLPGPTQDVWTQTVKWMIEQRTWRPCYEPVVSAFACLYAELQADPVGMQTFRLTQLRLLSGDLGFSPSHVDRVLRG